ncbi:predicted protein [Chaetoceros tenuissimus]|uniref:Uncharacterized protein n=1 Tax=Chaetoceros tenuissimus TaxID=426638 RepID=A0AAD3H1D6_9STRA|nr:predicted protein [Chaetoceros tenuissimus]
MFGKSFFCSVILAVICLQASAQSKPRRQNRDIRAVKRVVVKRQLKDTKDTKAPTLQPKTKAPTLEPKATKAPTLSPGITAAPVTTAPTDPTGTDELPEPSSKMPGGAAPMNSTEEEVMTCSADEECGEGFFCMEMFGQCCQYNTTCKVVQSETAESSSFSMAKIVGMTFVYAGIIAVVMW